MSFVIRVLDVVKSVVLFVKVILELLNFVSYILGIFLRGGFFLIIFEFYILEVIMSFFYFMLMVIKLLIFVG